MSSEKVLFFLQDGAAMSEKLSETLARLADNPADTALVHEAFRLVHSIKSEASFVGLAAVAEQAHAIESLLEGARTGGDLSKLVPSLFERVEQLEGMLFEIEQSHAAVPLEDASGESSRDEPAPKERASGPTRPGIEPAESGEDEPDIVLTEFERKLLREARERQEHFYRLSCRVEDSAPIKFAKAYLVVNNLELIANVIRTIPAFDERTDDNRYGDLRVLFTASVAEEQLYAAADVDQVEEVRIVELGFESLTAQEEGFPTSEPKALKPDGYVRVEALKLDDALEYIEEIKLLVRELERDAASSALARLVRRLESLVTDLRNLPVREAFRQLPRYARDLARGLGKRVQVELYGGDLVVDRRTISLVTDPLLHLVRNAVDHGIESPAEREALGKGPVGTVKVSAARKGGDLVVTVEDDGRGIARQYVVDRARQLGLDVPNPEDADLLDLIVQPGFSTRHTATSVSGRGVGLDLVFNQVTRVLGGSLSMESRVGRGSAFSLSVPASGGYLSVLLVRSSSATIGVPLRSVVRTVSADDERVSIDADGTPRLDGVPVARFTGSGIAAVRVKRQEDLPAGHIVEISYLETRSCLLVDELLFERDIPESNLVIERRAGSALAAVSIGGRRADFMLFRPGK